MTTPPAPETTLSLPSTFQYATLRMRVMRAAQDGSDVDRTPDALPVPSGAKVTITPPKHGVRVAALDDEFGLATTLSLDPIIGTFDSAGVLCARTGQRDIDVVCPTPDQDPYPWEYTIAVDGMGATFVKPFRLFPEPGRVYDLSLEAPAAPGGPVTVVASVAERIRAEEAATYAWDAVDAVDGVVARAVDSRLAELPAPRRTGNRAVILGDSIAAGADTVANHIDGSWFSALCEASGQRLQRVANAGVWGNTSAQILARVPDVLALQPDIVVLGAVTGNDVVNTPPVSALESRDNIAAAAHALAAEGVRVMLVTGPPIDASEPANARNNEMNRWLERFAMVHGYEVLDLHAALLDPADGTLRVGLSDDGAHLNAAGREAAVAYLLPRLPGDLTARPLLSGAKNDPTNLLANGVFIGGSDYADSWGQNGLSGGALEPRADGHGNWQRLDGTNGDGFLWTLVAGWEVGDRLAVSGEWINENGTATVEVTFTGSEQRARPINTRAERFADPRTFYLDVVVPAGTTAIYYSLVPGAGRARFGRQTIRNLTRLDVLSV